MPRIARIIVPEVPHHITQRGNNCQDVFFVDDDRRVYLRFLKENAESFGLQVIAYCLMPNHVHIIGTPRADDSLAKAMGRTHLRYTQHINRLHGRSGHLWQNRFFSCALDEKHLIAALRYVERNPVRATLVREAWNYDWSSAAAHVGNSDKANLLDLDGWRTKWKAEDWREMLRDSEDKAMVSALRSNTTRGRPLGTDHFLSKVEGLLGHRIRPLPLGRPRKAGDK